MKTFREQFDKLVKAYMNDEVKPMNPCACFVGNLLNGTTTWSIARSMSRDGGLCHLSSKRRKSDASRSVRIVSGGTYTLTDIYALERLFMKTWADGGETEESLFEAFEKTLAKLRQIHEANGEVINDYVFVKREIICQQTN